MNMKRIRIYIKNTIVIVLSMMVLAGGTGLSIKAHYCHGNLSAIAFYTELGIQQAASCGCKDDASAENSAISINLASLHKKKCCSNISFFSKLNIETPSNYFSSLVLVQPAAIAVIFDNAQKIASEKETIPAAHLRFTPPPLAGRKLVLFLSQQRIPLISYNC
jgi:hypothetical protein